MIKEEPRDCLIGYDDINLDMGGIRLRPAGSAGGHNGRQDIIERLGTREGPRLRIGIGRDIGGGWQGKDVLGPCTSVQRLAADQGLERACGAVVTCLRAGIEITMNRFNSWMSVTWVMFLPSLLNMTCVLTISGKDTGGKMERPN